MRYDKRVGGSSAVRFMTDGILLRQLQSDFLLRSYSVLLIDEAHERSLNTDLLLGEARVTGSWGNVGFLGHKEAGFGGVYVDIQG